jgi:hypothetical protein
LTRRAHSLAQQSIDRRCRFPPCNRRDVRVDVHHLRRETTAKIGIALKRPVAGWDNARIRTELGILMRLLGPLSQVLDATRAR